MRAAAGRAAAALAVLAVLVSAYLFLATAGTMRRFLVSESHDYARLAVALVDGHMDLIERPDPTVTGAHVLQGRFWDLSLRDGRLYLYWGPVPALLAAALLWAGSCHVTDAHLTFAFVLLRAVLGLVLLWKAKRSLFPEQPRWPTALGAVTLALGAPLTLVLSRSTVYEAAIAGAQAFLLAGMLAAFLALSAPPGRARRVLLLTASTAWALALGCRLGQAPACAALALFTLLACRAQAPGKTHRAELVADAALLSAPLAIGLLLQGVYDRMRFGSPWDTGLARQITSFDYHSGLRFVPANLYTYTLRPPLLEGRFPFVTVADWHGFSPLWLAPDDVHFEPNAGFLWSTPLYALAVVAWLALARWLLRAARRGSFDVVAPRPLLAWFTASSLALATLGLLPCVVSFCSTARYLFDGAAGLAFSATIGLSLLVASPRVGVRGRRLLAAVATALVAGSVLVNALLWVGGPYGHELRTRNAPLYDALAHAFGGAPSGG